MSAAVMEQLSRHIPAVSGDNGHGTPPHLDKTEPANTHTLEKHTENGTLYYYDEELKYDLCV